jgi:hypothetical protein
MSLGAGCRHEQALRGLGSDKSWFVCRGGSEQPFEQLINSCSKHLQMSSQQIPYFFLFTVFPTASCFVSIFCRTCSLFLCHNALLCRHACLTRQAPAGQFFVQTPEAGSFLHILHFFWPLSCSSTVLCRPHKDCYASRLLLLLY